MHCLLSQPECDAMLGLLVLLHHHHLWSSCSSDEENSLIAPDKIPTTTWLQHWGKENKCNFCLEMQIFSKSDIYVHAKNEMVKVAKNVREKEVIVRQKNSCDKQGCDGEKKNVMVRDRRIRVREKDVMVREKNSCERQ
jgi:hypothetical protein